MNTRWKSFAMGLALSAAAFTAQAAGALQFQPLHARDVPTLLQTPHARPLIVEIWSLNAATAARTSRALRNGGALPSRLWMW